MDSMIRVARFVPFFSLQYGGPVRYIIELNKFLKPYPIRSTIYAASEIDNSAKTRTSHYQKINAKFIVKRFDSYIRFRDYRVCFGLFRTLLRDSKNIDIFHSHAPRSFQEDIAALVALIKNKKLVITSHGILNLSLNFFQYFYERLKDLTIGSLEKKLLNIHYIAVTKFEAKLFKRFGISEENIDIIPHGIDINLFKPSDPSELIQKYNLLNKKIILYVGRLFKGKRIDILVNAFLLLKDEIPKAILIIAGGDYGYKTTLENLIKKYNLQKRVILLGFVPKNELSMIYSMANAVVIPSKSETFGNVVVEANACEKPVIASNHWGPKEIILDGKTGFLIEFEDVETMKEKIVYLLEDENRQLQMGKYAREHVKKNYSWEINAKKHYELYKKLLQK